MGLYIGKYFTWQVHQLHFQQPERGLLVGLTNQPYWFLKHLCNKISMKYADVSGLWHQCRVKCGKPVLQLGSTGNFWEPYLLTIFKLWHWCKIMYILLSSAGETWGVFLHVLFYSRLSGRQVNSENLTFTAPSNCHTGVRWNCHQLGSIGWWKHVLPCVYPATPTYTTIPPAAKAPVAARFGLERVGGTSHR